MVAIVPDVCYKLNMSFVDRLRKGHEDQLAVATELLRAGFWVHSEPLMVSGEDGTKEECSDNYDLLVTDDISHVPLRVEVKGRDLEFQSPGDYPYDSAFVCEKRFWDNPDNADTIYLIVLLSDQTGCMVCIDPKTEPSWSQVTKRDRVRNRVYTWYTCPKELLMTWDEGIGLLRSQLL